MKPVVPGARPLGRFTEIAEANLSERQRIVVDSFRARRGSVPTPFRIFLSSAPLAERLAALSDHAMRHGLLSPPEVETAVLVAAHRLQSSFVASAHRRIAASAGVPASEIDAILGGKDPASPDARRRAVHDCATAMLDRFQDDARFERIVGTLGDDGVVEVGAILGFYCTCAFTLGFYEVPDMP